MENYENYNDLLWKLLNDKKYRNNLKLVKALQTITVRSQQLGNTRRTVKYLALSRYIDNKFQRK